MASEIIGITGFFSTMIVLIISYFKTRHTERMALINSGRTAKIFDANAGESNNALKLGLFLLAIGLGLLIGMIIDNNLDTEPAGSFISILILGGLSLILYHSYIERNKKSNTNENDEMI